MKKVEICKDHEVIAYTDKDLEGYFNIIRNAKLLWLYRVEDYIKRNGDLGTCVCGAGISVYYLPKRARNPQKLMIINSPSIAQGSMSWEDSVGVVIKYLKDNGIEAHYSCGSMD